MLKPMSMLPSSMGPTGMGGTCAMCQSQCVLEIDGKEDAEEFAEGHAHRGDGPGLDDEKERPAVEKSPEGAERVAQVDVLAAGFGHHGGELAIAQGADHGHDRGDDPRAQIKRRRIGEARDVAVDNENAAADHGADDDGGGAEQAQALDQLRTGVAGCGSRQRAIATSAAAFRLLIHLGHGN